MTASNPTEHNKALVLAGVKGVFVDCDPTVLDRLFGDDYRQHNPLIANGTAAIKAVLKNLPPNFSYQPGLVVADGDYVMVHGRYVGWGPKPMVGGKRSPLRKVPTETACSLARRGEAEGSDMFADRVLQGKKILITGGGRALARALGPVFSSLARRS